MRNIKIAVLLMFAVEALHFGNSKAIDLIQGNCNDVIRLPCKATDRTKKYRYVTWYKGDSNAIIKKKKNEYTTYVNISVSVGVDETLEIYNAQPSDSGEYKCYLAAVVGLQNDESFIRLNISECVNMPTFYPSTMMPVESCPEVTELSVPWVMIGFSLITLAKIILCIVTVWVCDRVIFRKGRKKQEVSLNGRTRAGKTETDTRQLKESF